MFWIELTNHITLGVSLNSVSINLKINPEVLDTLENEIKDIPVPNTATEPSVQCSDNAQENTSSLYRIVAVTGVLLCFGLGFWYCYNSGDHFPPPGFGGVGDIFMNKSTKKLNRALLQSFVSPTPYLTEVGAPKSLTETLLDSNLDESSSNVPINMNSLDLKLLLDTKNLSKKVPLHSILSDYYSKENSK